MKLNRQHTLQDVGDFSTSEAWQKVEAEVKEAISKVVWPQGNDKFVINPTPLPKDENRKKADKHPNGVKPLKLGFQETLKKYGWLLEDYFPVTDPKVANPGPIDGVRHLNEYSRKPFLVEWETGNISSSHRALNKMSLALKRNLVSGGILVISEETIARYLTDRIGKFTEIAPYFDLYTELSITQGYLGVWSVEHDDTSTKVPHVPKGKDGNAPAFIESEEDLSEQLFS